MLSEVTEPSGQTLDPDQVQELEAGAGDLVPELRRVVEIGGREPMLPVVGIAMLTFRQITFDNGAEFGIEQVSAGQPIEERREPTDGCHGNDTRRANDPGRFPKSPHAVGGVGEMVEGPEEQHTIETVVRLSELPGVTDFCGHARRSEVVHDLVDMAGREVDDVHPVAIPGEPRGMDTRRPSDIEDPGRRCR